jgi:hypothetical protein
VSATSPVAQLEVYQLNGFLAESIFDRFVASDHGPSGKQSELSIDT